MAAITLFVTAALQLAPLIISLGRDIAPFAQMVIDAIKGGGVPTDAQWQAMHDLENSLRAELNAPEPAPAIVAPAAAAAGVTVS
jgi:hypothetical protein